MPTRKTTASADVLRGPREQSATENSRTLVDHTGAWLSTMNECQREIMDFIQMRLSKDGETTRELFNCRSPTEVAEVQSRWIQETFKDYGAETTKMLAIYTKQAATVVQNKR